MTLGTGRQGSVGEVAGDFMGVPAHSTGASMSCTVDQNHGLYGQNRPALRGPMVITSATSARCPPGVLRCECLQVSDGDAWLCRRLCPSRAGFIQGLRLSAGYRSPWGQLPVATCPPRENCTVTCPQRVARSRHPEPVRVPFLYLLEQRIGLLP